MEPNKINPSVSLYCSPQQEESERTAAVLTGLNKGRQKEALRARVLPGESGSWRLHSIQLVQRPPSSDWFPPKEKQKVSLINISTRFLKGVEEEIKCLILLLSSLKTCKSNSEFSTVYWLYQLGLRTDRDRSLMLTENHLYFTLTFIHNAFRNKKQV